MNGSKLIEELYTMTQKRIANKEAILKIFKIIDWSQYKKYGIEIDKQLENSIEFRIYKNYEIQDRKAEEEIRKILSITEITDDWRHLLYVYFSSLSDDKVLKNYLNDEHGIYFYADSESIRLSITKEGLSQL